MDNNQLNKQRIMILQTALTNIGVIIDQITSTDSDLDTKDIENNLKNARKYMQIRLKELQ